MVDWYTCLPLQGFILALNWSSQPFQLALQFSKNTIRWHTHHSILPCSNTTSVTTQRLFILLPQDYMKEGIYLGHILGGQMHKQLNSKRHMTMVSANLNALIQQPCIWCFLTGVFWVLANRNIFSTFWNSESLLKNQK